MTPAPTLPASLDDAHLVPWLVTLDYGDEDVIANEDAWAILYPAYAAKAAAVRALIAAKVRQGVCAADVNDTLDEDRADMIVGSVMGLPVEGAN